MKFTVIVDNKKLYCAMTGKTARLYREQFGEDLLGAMAEGWSRVTVNVLALEKETKVKAKDIGNGEFLGLIVKSVGYEQLEKVLWSALYSAGSTSLLYPEWLDSIEDYREMIPAAAGAYLTMNGAIQPAADMEGVEEQPAEGKKKKRR